MKEFIEIGGYLIAVSAIAAIYPWEPEKIAVLDALCDRVSERAAAYHMAPEEAFREALRGWLERTGESAAEPEQAGDRVLEATAAELDALKAVLAAMRSYDR